MYNGTYYQLMAQYNQWMNQKIYLVCSKLSDEQRKKDLGAFFKSIHGTLNHLLHGDKVLMGRLTNCPFSGIPIGQELYSDFGELKSEQEKTDQFILDWTKSLDLAWLNQAFNYISVIDGQQRIIPTWVLVTHMFNHQTHHRGQITTLLKQLGQDPGITDIPWLPCLNSEAYQSFTVATTE